MLTSDYIYKIDFEEIYGKNTIPHTVIFNITQISHGEVRRAICNGTWDQDDRIIELRPKQLECLKDKED